MLKKNNKITTFQLFTMLIISRLTSNLTYNPSMTSGGKMWDHVISLAISFFINFVLVVPVFLLNRQDSRMTIADNSISCFGKFGIILVLVYGAYYLFVSCYTLSLFNIFISNVMDPSLSIIGLSIAIILTSCYGAYKGIEGLARASLIIMFIITTAITFLAISITDKIDPLNYTPFLYDGPEQMVNGILFSVSRTACIPAMAMLLPFVRGKLKKGIVVWNVFIHCLLIVLIVIMVGSLGEYSTTHIFPIYAVTSIAELGMFKRLDALYLGVFTTALFVKISLFLFLFSLTMTKLFNEKVGKISIFVGGIFVAIIGTVFSNVRHLGQFFYNTPFVFTFTIITAFVIPLILLAITKIKNRKDVNLAKHS